MAGKGVDERATALCGSDLETEHSRQQLLPAIERVSAVYVPQAYLRVRRAGGEHLSIRIEGNADQTEY